MLAYNEATGETGEYLVTATIAHHDPTVVYLTISGETLTTTADHPFYTTDGEWIEAADLSVGDALRALGGGSSVVEAVTVAHDAQPMYNLTVDTAHIFFVGDGQWLVHNTECTPSRIRDFAHSSSLQHIDNIMKNGLNNQAAYQASRGGLVSRPGSFFTMEITLDTFPSIAQDLIGFGRRNTVDDKPSILIMRMPQSIFQELSSSKFVISRPIPGAEDLTEFIFLPKLFLIINTVVSKKKITWQLVDLFKNER